MNDYPVRAGSMLFTMVDPKPGHEVAYNRWYERDHFYAGCMVGPWLFAGSRWVATRELKDLRFPEDSSVAKPTDAGSYVAIYWVEEDRHDDHFGWAIDQVQWIYKNDRGFAERTHAHTALYEKPWSFYRDEDPVPIELALDHRYAGIAAIAIDMGDEANEQACNEWLTTTGLPELMNDSTVASMVSWKPSIAEDSVTGDAPMDLGSGPGGHDRRMQLFFLEEAPPAGWDRFRDYAAALEASGHATVAFAAPFIPTVIGTDTYTDQLW